MRVECEHDVKSTYVLEDDQAEYVKGRHKSEEVRQFYDHFPNVLEWFARWIDMPEKDAQIEFFEAFAGSCFFELLTSQASVPNFVFPTQNLSPRLMDALQRMQMNFASGSELFRILDAKDHPQGIVVSVQGFYFLNFIWHLVKMDKTDSPIGYGRAMGPRSSYYVMPPSYERLLLHYLMKHVPSGDQADLNVTADRQNSQFLNESQTGFLLLHLINEFWLMPESVSDPSHHAPTPVRPPCSPAVLNALHLVVMHMLTSGALFHAAQQAMGSRQFKPTHALSIFTHGLNHMIISPPPSDHDTLLLTMRIWLQLIQPWKAVACRKAVCDRLRLSPPYGPLPGDLQLLGLVDLAPDANRMTLDDSPTSNPSQWFYYVDRYNHWYTHVGQFCRSLVLKTWAQDIINTYSQTNQGRARQERDSRPNPQQTLTWSAESHVDTALVLLQMLLCFTDQRVSEMMQSEQVHRHAHHRGSFGGHAHGGGIFALSNDTITEFKRFWEAILYLEPYVPALRKPCELVWKQLNDRGAFSRAGFKKFEPTENSGGFFGKILSNMPRASPQPAPTTPAVSPERRRTMMLAAEKALTLSGKKRPRPETTPYRANGWCKPQTSNEIGFMLSLLESVSRKMGGVEEHKGQLIPRIQWTRCFANADLLIFGCFSMSAVSSIWEGEISYFVTLLLVFGVLLLLWKRFLA